MRIAVCCKAVPVDVEPGQVELSEGSVRLPSGDLFLNEVDEYALEAALALRKFGEAELWAVTVGSLRGQEAL
ncbi:MAG: hypothetical protein HY900_35485 [Deltaproteobacteria bacterium]|nr:hypothetical protein [Deltaproteobacteria bacterium]